LKPDYPMEQTNESYKALKKQRFNDIRQAEDFKNTDKSTPGLILIEDPPVNRKLLYNSCIGSSQVSDTS